MSAKHISGYVGIIILTPLVILSCLFIFIFPVAGQMVTFGGIISYLHSEKGWPFISCVFPAIIGAVLSFFSMTYVFNLIKGF